MSRHRVASRRVATWFWCRDLDWPEWCRDTDLMSRHGYACTMETGVATPFFGRDLGGFSWAEGRSRHWVDVATWLSCSGGRDLGTMSRPGLGQAAWACHDQCTPSMRATCAGCASDLRWLRVTCVGCGRYKLAVRAAAPTTWALQAQCARDLGSGCAHYAPNPVL